MPQRKGNGAGRGGPARGAGVAYGSAGDGWGGPAKGMPASERAAPFEPGNTLQMNRSGKAEMRAARTELLEEKLFNLAMEAEREETQMNAAARLHAIYNGQPVARNVNLNVDDVAELSDDAIRAELAAAGGEAASAAEGAAEAGVPEGPSQIRH